MRIHVLAITSLGVMGLVGSALVFASTKDETVQGAVSGTAAMVSGAVGGPLVPYGQAQLPPGGGFEQPLDLSFAEGRVLLTAEAVTDCSGQSLGIDEIFADCRAVLDDVHVSVDGVEVLRVDRIAARANVRSTGAAPEETTVGSEVTGLCVIETDGSCVDLEFTNAEEVVVKTEYLAGTLKVIDIRESEITGGVHGTGVTVVGLDFRGSAGSVGAITLQLATASAFVGNAGVCGDAPLATATPTVPMQTPEGPTATPTCAPRAVTPSPTWAKSMVVPGLSRGGE